MKTINVKIQGISPLLQHRYVFKDEPEKRRSGKLDYSGEWKDSLYYDDATGVFQPAAHLEGALIKAATNFQIEEGQLFIDKRLCRIKGAGIERLRPMLKSWQLEFVIEVHDNQIANDTVCQILNYAGRYIGIGDYRPKFGRFSVAKFD